MNTNRRGLLRAFAFAPAAAVAAKNSITEQITRVGAINGAAMLGNAGAQCAPGLNGMDSGWLQRELKEAVAHLAKIKEKPPKLDHLPDLLLAASACDTLRSVSPAAKLAMIKREVAERARAREVGWAEERIARLKEQLGPLGVLIGE